MPTLTCAWHQAWAAAEGIYILDLNAQALQLEGLTYSKNQIQGALTKLAASAQAAAQAGSDEDTADETGASDLMEDADSEQVHLCQENAEVSSKCTALERPSQTWSCHARCQHAGLVVQLQHFLHALLCLLGNCVVSRSGKGRGHTQQLHYHRSHMP